MHMMRTTPPAATEHQMALLHRDIAQLICTLIKFEVPIGYWDTVDGSITLDRIHLRIGDGGLGITDLSKVAHSAYIGSVALTARLIKERGVLDTAAEAFAPTATNLAGETAMPGLHAALQQLNMVRTDELKDLNCTTIWEECLKGVQAKLTAIARAGEAADILNRITDHADKAFFLSGTASEAGAFLTANWSRRGMSLDNDQWARAVRLRLGIKVLNIDGERTCPHDGAIINNKGLHTFGCKHGKLSGRRHMRHKRVQGVLSEMFKSLSTRTGDEVVWEPSVSQDLLWPFKNPGTAPDTSKDSADLLVRKRADPTEYTAIDLVVRNPSPASFNNAHLQAGIAAEQGWTDKMKSYNNRFSVPVDRLLPLSMEITGRLHPKAKQWLSAYVKKGYKADEKILSMFKWREVQERISVALQMVLAGDTQVMDTSMLQMADPLGGGGQGAGAGAGAGAHWVNEAPVDQGVPVDVLVAAPG